MASLLAPLRRMPVHQRWFALASVALTGFIVAIFLANIPVRRTPVLIYVANWRRDRSAADAVANGARPVGAHPAGKAQPAH